MVLDVAGDKSQVVHLRVRCSALDTLAAQPRMESLFRTAHIGAGGLSPSAIVFIRNLRDPMPGKLRLHSGGIFLPTEWERAVNDSVARLIRHAVRPVLGVAPANAEAVLFADEGEMLACLAMDMSLGQALERWWWRAILRTSLSLGSAGLPALLRKRATFLPAAFYHLAKRGWAATVVEALRPEHAVAVLSSMCRAFGLPDFSLISTDSQHQGDDHSQVKFEPERQDRKAETVDVHSESATGDLQPAAKDEDHPPSGIPYAHHAARRESWGNEPPSLTTQAPWEKWLPGQIPLGMTKERACLLGVALSLYSAPAAVRSDSFRNELRAWWRAADPIPSRSTSPPAPSIPRAQVEFPAGPVQKSRIDAVSSDGSEFDQLTLPSPFVPPPPTGKCPPEVKLVDSDNPGLAAAGATPAHEIGPNQSLISEPMERTASVSEDPIVAPIANTHATPERRDQLGSQDFSEPATQAVPPDTPLRLENGVDTQLGGVLYLVNLMLRLDLPACFEKDWGLASRIGAWGVLESLARGLLVDDDHALSRDPIWTVLAQLDGREPGKLPGRDFVGAECRCLPADWLAQLAGEQNWPFAFPEIASVAGSLAEGLNPHLTRWLEFVLPYIRVRMRQSLGLAGTGNCDLQSALLLRRGRLYVTSTHVDLVMNLADVSVPIRMAGLDRNPGWLPDFGRVVLFHFE